MPNISFVALYDMQRRMAEIHLREAAAVGNPDNTAELARRLRENIELQRLQTIWAIFTDDYR